MALSVLFVTELPLCDQSSSDLDVESFDSSVETLPIISDVYLTVLVELGLSIITYRVCYRNLLMFVNG